MSEKNHPSLSVAEQCRLLSISRSSFYCAPQGETALNLDLMLLIDKQFLDTPFYDLRRMTWHLQKRRPYGEPKTHPAAHAPYADLTSKRNTSKPRKGHKTYPYPAWEGCGSIGPDRSGAPT